MRRVVALLNLVVVLRTDLVEASAVGDIPVHSTSVAPVHSVTYRLGYIIATIASCTLHIVLRTMYAVYYSKGNTSDEQTNSRS